MKLLSVFFSLSFVIISCNNNTVPKPNGYLNLSYPKVTYKSITNNKIPYTFEYSNQASFNTLQKHWADINYPSLKADINITYQKVDNNLESIISDAEKLTYKHVQKADDIGIQLFENNDKKVYAKLFNVTGNAASPIQFQATDSVKHFLSGSLYFNIKPNYDSIIPAIAYVKKDIQHLINSLQWIDNP